MPALRAGKLTKRLALQSKSEAADGGGGVTETWSTYATVWAAGNPVTGREQYEAQQVEGVVDFEWEIRYRSDVRRTHRALFGSTVYAIEAVLNPKMENESLVLLCREETNEEGVT